MNGSVNLASVLRNIAYNGPTRVVINSGGETKSSLRARKEDNIVPDVIFVRHDGWSLGAPRGLVSEAESKWPGDWVMVIYRPFPRVDGHERVVIRGM